MESFTEWLNYLSELCQGGALGWICVKFVSNLNHAEAHKSTLSLNCNTLCRIQAALRICQVVIPANASGGGGEGLRYSCGIRSSS